MKKIKSLAILALAGCALTSCSGTGNYYTDDAPLALALSSEKLTILQITDLHLTFGIDYNDRKTFRLIDALAKSADPDIIVCTGDISMSPLGPSLFTSFYDHMEKLGIPWTFVFGNHETDSNSYGDYLGILKDKNPTSLLFKAGPEMADGDYGNFIISATYGGNPFYNLYLMDSKAELADYAYDYFSPAQVAWYDTHAAQDATDGIDSLAFMHMPLVQYNEYPNYSFLDGSQNEVICNQSVDTGFFQSVVDNGVTKAIFAGHDHTNNFRFVYQGVMLAYGTSTGYNGYGTQPKGGRVIEIASDRSITSYNLLDSEVSI